MGTKEKKRERIFLGILAALLLVVNVLAFQGQAGTEVERVSGTPHLSEKAKEYTQVFRQQSDVLVQYFKPKMDYMKRIRVRLYLTNREEERNGIRFAARLYDEKDELVLEQIFSLGAVQHRYYTIKVAREVNTQETYRLELRPVTDIPVINGEPVSTSCLISQEKVEESIRCTMNGEPLEGNIDVLYSYRDYTILPFWKMVVGDLLLIGFVLLNHWRAGKGRKKTWRTAALQWILWAAVPVVMFVVMEALAGNWGTIQPLYLVKNLVMLYMLYFLFSMAFSSQKTAGMAYSVTLALLGLVQYYVLLFRGRPFMIFDLMSVRTAMDVAGGYSYAMALEQGLWLLCLFGVLTALFYHQGMRLPKNRILFAARMLLVAGAVVGAGVSLKLGLVNRLNLERMDLWMPKDNYNANGTMYTLLMECQYIHVEKPEGYGPEKAESIAAAQVSQEKERAVTPENLILIMNESLSDMEEAGDLKTDTELMPFLHSLKKTAVKGLLQVPVFGGGTADSEYEALTGNSKIFLPAATVAYEFYSADPEYGMAQKLKDQGYRAVALHPHRKGNWNRLSVYRFMDFDQFISKDEWGEMEMYRKGDSDEDTYRKVIQLTEEKEKGEKLFTFLVTMQNHGGYSDDGTGFESTVTLNYDKEYPMAETYLTLMKESDRALQGLIQHFEKVKEPTMIVLFGDHYPSVEEEFYQQLLGTHVDDMTLEQRQIRYQTPYIIWTNYDIGEIEDAGETMSANYLGSYIMQQAGLRLSPYDNFLLELKKTLPIIGNGAVCDSQGVWYALDQLPPEYQELMNQYSILQYNRVKDRGNLCKDIFTLANE
ncbi:MAG: LTA synthase family protein [Eubacteriales bacterium]|nr:LTA synthase family protein [Eubacteriales bacterium]